MYESGFDYERQNQPNEYPQGLTHLQDPTRRDPIPVAPRPHKKSHRGAKRAAVLLCACVVTSAAAGFGGGYLASSLAQPEAQAAPAASQAQTALTAAASPAAAGDAMSVSQIVEAVSDSVVEINTETTAQNLFRQTVTAQAAGSGVIISQDGYIVTNNHVIDGAQQITVRLKDGTSYDATLVGADPQTDVAVLKVEATGLQAAQVGDSASLQVGDTVVAIGNPLGELGGTVTNGIISATSRQIDVEGQPMTLLQTNAAINPGNSGGGLFNDQGQLVGIVVAKTSATGVEGLGFAIPVDTAQAVWQDLITNGYVTGRGELGVSVIDVTDQRMALMYRLPQLGVYVAGVENGSAAQTAGLQVGDGILAVNGVEVSSADELKAQLEQCHAGDQVTLTVLRDGGQQEQVIVTLQEQVPENARQTVQA
ncbi:MAG TPA: trypsin-like peptidase domain-containing protein [Candidatus Anaerotruncus excrementipullorum]|uniref:Trypsin-like peptidase domain-containing protein n=1 Tax=Candidatus Anaerotruncus excrementipullorum TaxID=2838465 RepID=A0A9D1WQJ8_9FIRM|nr:trypsin-like peptidase domain-containing protein [Candidatus Anaerotruncus excrementipullorum]